jgi:uncharacterized membrane protein YecN with MAPEG domain
MSPLPTATILYAGILGLIALFISNRVSRTRYATKVDLGDGGNERMLRAIRVFGNFAEYVPLILILILLIELVRGPRVLVHGLGIALVLARLLHAWGMSRADARVWRLAGAGLNYLVLLVAAVACIYYGVIWHAI